MRTHEKTGILGMLLTEEIDRRLLINVSEEKPSNMEGCPRSSMLNVDLKDSSPTEFTTQLKKVSIYKAHSLLFLSKSLQALDIYDVFRLQCSTSRTKYSRQFLYFSYNFQYISEHYQEDPESYKHECQQIEALRVVRIISRNDIYIRNL